MFDPLRGRSNSMGFESISKLFNDRDVRLDSSDIQHGIESFLQEELHSERIHCRIVGASSRVDIRVGTPALAEAILIRERAIRNYGESQLHCSLGEIRIMLEV